MNNSIYDIYDEIDNTIKSDLSMKIRDVSFEWYSLDDVINLMKRKDNSNEKVITWYLKSKDNVSDVHRTFSKTNYLVEEASKTHSTEVYINLYKMYDNIATFIEHLLVSNKIVKQMDISEYHELMSILNDGIDTLDKICQLPNVSKNVNKSQKMKDRQRNILIKIREYGQIDKRTSEEKKEDRKQLFKKSLAAAAGFVTGAAMSCVPCVGTIRMGVAATKIATSSINAWIDRHPDGNVAKVFGKLKNKLSFVSPKLPKLITNVKEKMRGNYVNIFINGMSVGYIVGNIFELVTGKTLLDFIDNQLNSVSTTPVSIETSTTDNSINIKVEDTSKTIETSNIGGPEFESAGVNETTVVTGIPITISDDIVAPPIEIPDEVITIDPIITDAINPTIDFNQSIDVSDLKYGYYSSFDPMNGAEPVKLFTDLGHNVHIGNENVLADGTKMWALFQEDGTGYAWFKADDVIDLISKQEVEGIKLVLK